MLYLDKEVVSKYIAIKLAGLSHYIWFDRKQGVTSDGVRFHGRGGWGKEGASTHVDCLISDITSIIYSNELKYR